MTTIFGASGASTTPNRLTTPASKDGRETVDVDVAEHHSVDVKLKRILKAAWYGVALQLIFIPWITLFVKYPTELVFEKTSSFDAVFEGSGFKNPWYVLTVVARIIGVYFSPAVITIIFATFASAFTLAGNVKVFKSHPKNKVQWFRYWSYAWLWISAFFIGLWTLILTRCYISIVNWEYYNISYSCDEKNLHATCIHEKHLFVAVCSFVVGFSTYWDWIVHEKFVVKFPTIQKDNMDVIRLSLLENIWETIGFARYVIPMFYFIYYLEGGLIRQLLSTLGFTLGKPELGSFSMFFDLEMWIQTAVWPVVSLFFVRTTWKLLEFTTTENLGARPAVMFQSTNELLLHDCMTSKDPLMKYLGFYEFKLRTCANSKTILDFFILSHPGGHPRIWNGVIHSTLSLCEQLEATLRKYCQPISRTTETLGFNEATPMMSLYSVGHASDSNSNDPDNGDPALRQRQRFNNMRDLTYPPTHQLEEKPSLSRIFLMSPFILSEGIKRVMKEKLHKIYSYILHLWSRFEEVEPELEIANAISQYQLIMWGINGIVEIVCVSIEHDRYGVVQRDMTSLIQCLVNLHEALIHYSRCPPRAPTYGSGIRVKKETSRLVHCLAQGCQYALAKIHGRFVTYYEILGVSKEYQSKVLMISQLYQKPQLRSHQLR